MPAAIRNGCVRLASLGPASGYVQIASTSPKGLTRVSPCGLLVEWVTFEAVAMRGGVIVRIALVGLTGVSTMGSTQGS